MGKHRVGVLLPCFFLGFVCSRGFSEDGTNDIQMKVMSRPVPFSQVRLCGELGSRYAAATYNLLTRTDRYSLDSFAANAAGKPGAM